MTDLMKKYIGLLISEVLLRIGLKARLGIDS
jgi:hypothetical protein